MRPLEETSRIHNEAYAAEVERDQKRDETYQRARTKYGDTFSPHYHNYSEGLFLDACSWLQPGQIAIDAGCYLADNALRMAKHVGPTGLVFTFEPDPRLRVKAAAAIAASPFGSSVRLVEDALADALGEVEFLVVNEIEGHSGLRKKANYGREVTVEKLQVNAVTLDGFLDKVGAAKDRVRLIKFDLEGGEFHAFQGARKTLLRGRPLVMFEYGNLQTFGVTADDFIGLFNACGYLIRDCFGFPMRKASALSATIGWNLFAVPSIAEIKFLERIIEPKLKAFLG